MGDIQKALPELKQIKVPRCTLIESIKEIELHCFADASKFGYGGVIYLSCVSKIGEVKVTLLCSKSRISPIKAITIPRLELCAAELLSKLVCKVITSLSLYVDKVILYADSTIVLAWIATSPSSSKSVCVK
ncbi:uncharacterized protein LOC118180739 [Stegodyphus dumicola]|uniref:uncharacterized protein LOC118180739 n=1 Tax=Stegodyphus dumicola TaxID=202533 RepID=UPI0015ADE97C|nr:uncharacterized protein LOC118180739 [Stegodyphus dumicola]